MTLVLPTVAMSSIIVQFIFVLLRDPEHRGRHQSVSAEILRIDPESDAIFGMFSNSIDVSHPPHIHTATTTCISSHGTRGHRRQKSLIERCGHICHHPLGRVCHGEELISPVQNAYRESCPSSFRLMISLIYTWAHYIFVSTTGAICLGRIHLQDNRSISQLTARCM